MANIKLIPYAILKKGKSDVITISSSKKNYIEKEPTFYGLENVSINFAGSYVEVLVDIVLSQNIIRDASGDNNILKKLLAFDERFVLEYGWAGEGSESKYLRGILSDLCLAGRPSLKYDRDKRAFSVSLQLISANSLVMSEIKMGNLPEEDISKIRRYMDSSIKFKPTGGQGVGSPSLSKVSNTDLKNASLASIISTLLDSCRKVIRGLSVDVTTSKMSEYTVSSPSVILINSEESDIPSIEDISLVCFDTQKADDSLEMSCTDLATSFSQSPMANMNALDDLLSSTDRNNYNVLQFIDSLLSSNGFTIWQTPNVVDNKGKMKWTILQNLFNNAGNSCELTNMADPSSVMKNGSSFKTVVNKNSNLDVGSSSSVIISIDANIDSGESSVFSIAANQAFANQNNYKAGESNMNYLTTYYDSLAKEAKNISMEMIGAPSLSLFDSIDIRLAGTLFSGRYRIIKIKHTINTTFTTSIDAVQNKVANKNLDINGAGGVESIEIPVIKLIPDIKQMFSEPTEHVQHTQRWK